MIIDVDCFATASSTATLFWAERRPPSPLGHCFRDQSIQVTCRLLFWIYELLSLVLVRVFFIFVDSLSYRVADDSQSVITMILAFCQNLLFQNFQFFLSIFSSNSSNLLSIESWLYFCINSVEYWILSIVESLILIEWSSFWLKILMRRHFPVNFVILSRCFIVRYSSCLVLKAVVDYKTFVKAYSLGSFLLLPSP